MASQAKMDVTVPREKRENRVCIKLFSSCLKYLGFKYVRMGVHVHVHTHMLMCIRGLVTWEIKDIVSSWS